METIINPPKGVYPFLFVFALLVILDVGMLIASGLDINSILFQLATFLTIFIFAFFWALLYRLIEPVITVRREEIIVESWFHRLFSSPLGKPFFLSWFYAYFHRFPYQKVTKENIKYIPHMFYTPASLRLTLKHDIGHKTFCFSYISPEVFMEKLEKAGIGEFRGLRRESLVPDSHKLEYKLAFEVNPILFVLILIAGIVIFALIYAFNILLAYIWIVLAIVILLLMSWRGWKRHRR